MINRIQYGEAFAALVDEGSKRGAGALPVADYRLAVEVPNKNNVDAKPSPVFSFCMCPGGQARRPSHLPGQRDVDRATLKSQKGNNGRSASLGNLR